MPEEVIVERQRHVVQNLTIQRPTFWAVDIFSGAGGLSIGAEMAGISVKLAVEMNVYASETFAFNHPNAKVIEQDICEVDPLEHIDDEVFIVFGGPPCQGFSTSNTKTRNSSNKNNYLFNEFLKFVRDLRPRWFLFENVEGITSYEGGGTVATIKNIFEKMGYTTNESVLCASDYGVPQDRNRFIMVGNRLGINFTFPKKKERKITVREALEDLPKLNNGDSFYELPYTVKFEDCSKYIQLMRGSEVFSKQNMVSRNSDYVLKRYEYIAPGQNWKAIPDELMKNYSNKNNCHSGIYKRLDPDKPSVVISNYRKNMLIHPYQHRGLSVREAARLQSFPDNFIFKGPLMHIQQQIGNAVPPLLARSIFEQIIRLNNDREI